MKKKKKTNYPNDFHSKEKDYFDCISDLVKAKREYYLTDEKPHMDWWEDYERECREEDRET